MANSVDRYYQKKKRRKKKIKIVFFGLLFILMMLTLGILSVTVFFNAEEIIVEGNTRYTAKELLEQGELSVGQNLFRLDKFKTIEKMQEFPYVKEVEIDRKLPNTLVVKVIENQPVVWVRAPGGAALLNEEYRVLEMLEVSADAFPEESDLLKEEPKVEISTSKEPAEDEEETKEEEKPQEEPQEEPEEEQKEEEKEEEKPKEPHPRLAKIPQLTPLKAEKAEVGEIAQFGEKEQDYTGFLKELYEVISRDEQLQWAKVDQVHFAARYDIRVVYSDRVVIDFGTLDQAETKVELASYLLKDNGTAQTATVDVSDPNRVYYRPKK